MKNIINIILTAIKFTGCTPIIGSEDVFELNNVEIVVTEKTYTNLF